MMSSSSPSTYKAKLTEASNRLYAKSIAASLLDALNKIRADTRTSFTRRRWIWELIQNAKDVHPQGGVSIRIECDFNGHKPHVTFIHNGIPFTIDDIRFLIEQVSTKSREKDEIGKSRKSGRFGTGFLTTHLLSEIVRVGGVVKEPDLNYKRFQLTLDRRGNNLEEITDAVQVAKNSLDSIDAGPDYEDYQEGEFSNSFRYELDEPGIGAAQAGIDDLPHCLPYTLMFVDDIQSVTFSSGKRLFRSANNDREIYKNIRLRTVCIDERDGSSRSFTAVQLSNRFTSIVIPVEVNGENISLLPIENNIPRLFCDFPLIGTEKVPIPAIVNNPNFNPTEPRDGVILTSAGRPLPASDENKTLLMEAVELYMVLVRCASTMNWGNLHLLAQFPVGKNFSSMDGAWFNANVSAPIRKRLTHEKIVNTATGELLSMLDEKGQHLLWFPKGSTEEIRDGIWHFSSYWFPHRLPSRTEIELWNDLDWEECGQLTLTMLAEFIQSKKTTDELLKSLLQRCDVHNWLNEFYALLRIQENEYNNIINKLSIFPDQNGTLRKKQDLFRDSGDISDEFKEILNLLGRDIRCELVANAIDEPFEGSRVRGREYVVSLITNECNSIFTNREKAKNYRDAFKKLLEYFYREPVEANRLFPEIVNKAHYLLPDEVIMDSLNKAQQFSKIMAEFGVKDENGLRELLTQHGKSTEDTLDSISIEDLLISLGIASSEDLEKALNNDDLAATFAHRPKPTKRMFELAQQLIAEARDKVIAQLRILPEYNLDDMEVIAPTVLAGVRKDRQRIYITVRPAKGGYVVIYYGSELDVLDFVASELWIYDGNSARRISLGHILKTSGIRKLPV